jgi:hypothetical protein
MVDLPKRRPSARIDISLLPDRTLHLVHSKAKGSDFGAAHAGVSLVVSGEGAYPRSTPRLRRRHQTLGFYAGTWQSSFFLSTLVTG